MSVLYVCYQSLFDPLTQTQVVAYLEGLSTPTNPIVLLTYEPAARTAEQIESWQRRLASRGIVWKRLTYHKRPTLPATIWDIVCGIIYGRRLIRQYKVNLVHCRSHVPAAIGAALKWMTGVRMLFDVRGLLADEYVDAGIWKRGGGLFRLTKRTERKLIEAADALVVLTERARELLELWYPAECAGKAMAVIPCCVDLDRFPTRSPRVPSSGSSERRLAYVGKLGGWYLVQEMVEFAAVATRRLPHIQWQVWTQSDAEELRSLVDAAGLSHHVSIDYAAPVELATRIAKCDAGIALIRPCLSKQASSPTKVGEYLAAGLPVVGFAGVGDLDDILSGRYSADGRPVGVLIRESTPAAYEQACDELLDLWHDPDTPTRCREVARRLFDLREVGWRRYRDVYVALNPREGVCSSHNRDCESADIPVVVSR